MSGKEQKFSVFKRIRMYFFPKKKTIYLDIEKNMNTWSVKREVTHGIFVAVPYQTTNRSDGKKINWLK